MSSAIVMHKDALMKSLLACLLFFVTCSVMAQDSYDLDVLGSQDCTLSVTLNNSSAASLSVIVSQNDVLRQSLSIEASESALVQIPSGMTSYRFHTEGSVPLVSVHEAADCVHPDAALPQSSPSIDVPKSRAEALGLTEQEYADRMMSTVVQTVAEALSVTP